MALITVLEFCIVTPLEELCLWRHAVLRSIGTQELDDFIAKGITGTGQGFDAPSVGCLGARGFGGHNPSPADLRRKMIQVSVECGWR